MKNRLQNLNVQSINKQTKKQLIEQEMMNKLLNDSPEMKSWGVLRE